MSHHRTLLSVCTVAVFVSGCLVLGAPRQVQLYNATGTDSLELTSFPNGFYWYRTNFRDTDTDSMQIYDPIKGAIFPMKRTGEHEFYYNLRAKRKQREQLGYTIVQRRSKSGSWVSDTLRYQGSLRKF